MPAAVHAQLKTMSALKRGRTTAKEMLRKKPAPQDLVDAVKPFVSRQIWAMIRLQLLSACRPGEITKLRPCDLDRRSRVWLYTLDDHKTAHHSKTKTIYFGPQAQDILQSFLEGREASAYLFSPTEAEQERRQAQHERRQTPLSCGNRPGPNRRGRGMRVPSNSYDEASYRRAIARGCEAAFPPPEELRRQRTGGTNGIWESKAQWQARLGPEKWKRLAAWRKDHHWHPHQLRHNAATHVRREFGLGMAQAILGNSSVPMAELYAEIAHLKVSQIMEKIG